MSPSVAPARAVQRPRRVQGLNADISDLVLRDGRRFAFEIGDAILPTPQLTRTMGGASTVTLDIHDPEMRWLRWSLLSQQFDCIIDGLHFRYVGCSKTGKMLSLTFEDRDVARLRELRGPKKAYRSETTRAEFIVSLVRELKPAVPIHVPELHVVQPIKSEAEGRAAQAKAEEDRGGGVDGGSNLTVKGKRATAAQVDVGDRALRAAASHGAPFRVRVALIEALAVESVFGDAASNLLGMTPETEAASKYSATVVEEACAGFLLGYVPGHEGAIAYFSKHSGVPAHVIAQAVQKSGAGAASNGASNYGVWESEARRWVEAFDGEGGAGAAGAATEPYTYEVGEKENYWQAIQRLAQEVRWRAFFVGGRFFYLSEDTLVRSKVRFALDPDTEGIENIDFDYDRFQPITEATATAYAAKWVAPPGSVVTLAGYGPASVGFGTPEPKANAKGQRMGISGNRKAATGEGRGRYLVAKVEVPLTGKGQRRLATATLRKPVAPLPEPAANSAPAAGTGTTDGSTPEPVQRMLDFARGEIGKPYVWGASGPDSYDCSGFVSRVLIVGGVLSSRLTTSGLASWGESGEGEWVTVHDKVGTGSSKTEHVVIEIAGEFFECGGISGGVGRPDYSSPALAEFSIKRHPKGL